MNVSLSLECMIGGRNSEKVVEELKMNHMLTGPESQPMKTSRLVLKHLFKNIGELPL